MLIDTSVWILLFRGAKPEFLSAFEKLIAGQDYYLSRLTQTELLQGAKDEKEWLELNDYLMNQDYIELKSSTFIGAARIYYNLRPQGITVRNTIDCLIAASAIDNDLLLVHYDRDFEAIALKTNLKQLRLKV